MSEEIQQPTDGAAEITQVEGAQPQETGGAEAGEGSAAVETGAKVQVEAADKAAQAALEKYAPNFKFQVKGKDMEFDEWAKKVVTNKEMEDKIREMYEKAHGLEEVKLDRQTVRGELKEYKDKYGRVEQSLHKVASYIQQNDFDSFFQALSIPEDKFLVYAIKKLQERELPQEQRQALAEQRAAKAQAQQMETQMTVQQEQYQNMIIEQKRYEFDMVFSKPETDQIAKAFDARVGKPGAFREEVIKRGDYYETVLGKLIPVSQAVDEIVSTYGLSAQAQGSQPQAQQPSVPVQAQSQKPVIPNLKGSSGQSPVKQVPKSLDDIRKLRDQMLEQEAQHN
jgi:hypothetical protein